MQTSQTINPLADYANKILNLLGEARLIVQDLASGRSSLRSPILRLTDEEMAQRKHAEVWALIEDIPAKYGYEDVKGRLWDVLNMALFEIKAGKQSGPEMFFEVILHHSDGPSPAVRLRPAGGERVQLKLHVGPGDSAAPVLTLMLPEQD